MKKQPKATTAPQLRERVVAELKPHPHNSRRHSAAQIKQLIASIREFGWTRPVLIDQHDQIIAGHGSWTAAQEMGRETVPTLLLAHLSEAQVRAYVIADNRLAEESEWDKELLSAELGILQEMGIDLQLLGFGENEVDRLLAAGRGRSQDPDAVPPLSLDAVCEPGELWVLGDHRLLCGDATRAQDLATLMEDVSADCVWTDPPYNVVYGDKASMLNRYDKGHRVTSIIENDDMDTEAFYQFLLAAMGNACGVCSDGAPAYVCHSETEGQNFRRAFRNAGFYLSSCLIWRKNSLVLSRSDYHWQHEPILYGWKEGGSHRWYGGRDKTSIQELIEPPAQQTAPNEWQISLGERVLVITGQDLKVQDLAGTVFLEEKPTRSAEHPTMKPVALIARQLRNSTQLRDVVLDPFAGSGSTLIACEQTGRRGRMLELVPHYCDVIIQRWQDFTGRPAVSARTKQRWDALARGRKAGAA